MEQQNNYDEQQQKIIKYIIKNAPYGETQDVLIDLAKLVDKLDIEDPFIQNLIKEHNEEHLAIVHGDQGQVLLTTPVSYTDGFYIDQKVDKRYKVNNLTLKIESEENIDIQKNQTFEEYRNIIDKQLQLYMQDYYKDGNYGTQIYVDWDDDNFTFYICLTCKNLNLKNFHGGEWISEWKIDTNGLEGKVRVNSHYFEEGNVALKDIKKISSDITFQGGDKEEEAKAIIKFIREEESKIQKSLEEMYDQMNDQFFKGMRRILPVTNQKMEWNLYAQKMRGNLNI